MDDRLRVRCLENEAIALYLRAKRDEIQGNSKGKEISENLDSTIAAAYRGICEAENPIRDLKDLSRIKGVGKWMIRLMRGAFQNDEEQQPSQEAAGKGKKHGAQKRYLPQKNSVAYALLITLYRGMSKGKEFMKKQELIDEAEASGLSRTLIGKNEGKGWHRQYGNSAKDWYTGWNCMKILIDRGLVVKSSCPAKYMLTEQGKITAVECVSRSGLAACDEVVTTSSSNGCSSGVIRTSEFGFSCAVSVNRNIRVSDDTSPDEEFSGGQDWENMDLENAYLDTLNSCSSDNEVPTAATSSDALHRPFTMQACSKSGHSSVTKSFDHTISTAEKSSEIDYRESSLAMPPFTSGESFDMIYDVVLLLDDRENFGSRLNKVMDGIRSQFKVQVEVRRLPIGDGIWIARHKQYGSEYVLDFVVERKRIDDLCSSIKDNRYKEQKSKLLRCGLHRLIYLIEGDPNSSEASERIKTACFTTEILEGFDVQRTLGTTETIKKYGFLTRSIIHLYTTEFPDVPHDNMMICPTFDEFIKRCQDNERLRVRDVFSLQLMQVPQVTEETALAVVKMFPTLHSLAHAYAALECDIHAQEEMLKVKGLTNSAASRNIFKFVWGD